MSIRRQFMLLVVAFAVAMPAAVGGLAYVLYQNQGVARKIADDGNRQTHALFVLVSSVSQAQGAVQRLVREKVSGEADQREFPAPASHQSSQSSLRAAAGGLKTRRAGCARHGR